MLFKHLAYRSICDSQDMFLALRESKEIKEFLAEHPNLASDIDTDDHPVLTLDHKIVLLKVIIADQGDVVFFGWEEFGKSDDQKKFLAEYLLKLEKFYGIIAYSKSGIRTIDINTGKTKLTAPDQTISPTQLLRAYNLTPAQQLELKKAVLTALSAHEKTGQSWVIGGAADRLNFKDAQGMPLPQGEYPIDTNGRTLFALYFDDLLALASIHRHLTGRVFKQPVAAMTSEANDERIRDTFIVNDFYGYGRAHIRTAAQILVPVVGNDYKWCMDPKNPYKIMAKPHGHGDYYQMMITSGIFAELERDGIEVYLMRQVNNPLAHRAGLEAVGVLLDKEKQMVFLTIPRRATAPEGSLVMVREITPEGNIRYQVYNIEYSELVAAGIQDVPMAGTKQLSPFGGNLNAFAFRKKTVEAELVLKCPFPGELINLKKAVITVRNGEVVFIIADRLEAQMQGAAKLFEINSDRELSDEELANLLPVVTFDGQREEIFYVAKEEPDIRKGHINDTPLTARKALIDRRAAWLLEAGVEVPHQLTETVAGNKYPETSGDVVLFLSTIFAFTPEILREKIEGGRIGRGSYLEVDGEHVRLENVDLEGSLVIKPQNRIGEKGPDGEETPDPQKAGKVILQNVKIRNTGRRKKWVQQEILPLGLEERKDNAKYPPLTREQAMAMGLNPEDHAKYGINPDSADKQRTTLSRLLTSNEYGEDNQYLKIFKSENDPKDHERQGQRWGYTMAWLGDYEEDKEEVTIEVEGNGEFQALNVTLSGDLHIIVPDGHRITFLPSGNSNGYTIEDDLIDGPSWFYTVSVNTDANNPQIFQVRRTLVPNP